MFDHWNSIMHAWILVLTNARMLECSNDRMMEIRHINLYARMLEGCNTRIHRSILCLYAWVLECCNFIVWIIGRLACSNVVIWINYVLACSNSRMLKLQKMFIGRLACSNVAIWINYMSVMSELRYYHSYAWIIKQPCTFLLACSNARMLEIRKICIAFINSIPYCSKFIIQIGEIFACSNAWIMEARL